MARGRAAQGHLPRAEGPARAALGLAERAARHHRQRRASRPGRSGSPVAVIAAVVGLVLWRTLRAERSMTGRAPRRRARGARPHRRRAPGRGRGPRSSRRTPRPPCSRPTAPSPGPPSSAPCSTTCPAAPRTRWPWRWDRCSRHPPRRSRVAADTFDAVRYGRRAATVESARAVIDLDASLSTTRPVLPDPATAASPR